MENEKRLLNKKVVITGGSRGIGAGIVKRLFLEGAEIIIVDVREELAKNLIDKVDNGQGKITFKKVDLSEEKEIIDLFSFIKDKWSGLDILVNNAGIEDGFLLKDPNL